MNYEQPRQIKDGPNAGKWHYTLRNDDRIYPIGYCGRYKPCPDCKWNPACPTCEGKGAITIPEAERCQGHEAASGARAHYRTYLFDHHLYLDGQYGETQYHCEVCGAWTQGYAELQHTYMKSLCDEHRTRETMERLIPSIGDSIHS